MNAGGRADVDRDGDELAVGPQLDLDDVTVFRQRMCRELEPALPEERVVREGPDAQVGRSLSQRGGRARSVDAQCVDRCVCDRGWPIPSADGKEPFMSIRARTTLN